MELSIKMFMGLMLIIGLTLTIFAFMIADNVTTCNVKAQNAVRGLLAMGVALFCISATMLTFGCANFSNASVLGMVFIVVLLLIGITTIGLVSVIITECKPAKSSCTVPLILSIIVTISSAGYLGYKGYLFYNKNQQPSGLNKSEASTPALSPGSSFGG